MASQSNPTTAVSPESFYDLPPESFWVATADEQDWFNRNAVMQRKTSLKLGFNRNHATSKSFPHRSDAAVQNRKQSRTSLLGLHKGRKSFGSDKNLPEKKPLHPLFRSRSEPGGKAAPVPAPAAVHVVITDPGSPRVSCTGRIGAKARGSSGDCKKTGLSKLIGSLFGTGSGNARPRKGCRFESGKRS